MNEVDLGGAEIVDAHTHPYRQEDLLAKGSEGFDTRATFLGESFQSSSRLDPKLWPYVGGLTGSTVLGIALVRWLARHLGCEETREAVTAAREAALRSDATAYTKGLLESAGVGSEATVATSDPNCVAFKSIVAYRTGLDVGDPSASEAAEAFVRWRDDGWRETRQHAKPVRDFLIRRALEVAKANDRPFHFHSGGGDPDIDLAHATPQSLFPLLVDVQDQPVLLVHSGYPWIREAAYIASVLPHVSLELSELIPWGWGQVEWALEMLVGTVPAAKLLYGSDEDGEPEAFWASALLARASLERVLARFVDRDYVSVEQAERLGRLVLAGACRGLHGIG